MYGGCGRQDGCGSPALAFGGSLCRWVSIGSIARRPVTAQGAWPVNAPVRRRQSASPEPTIVPMARLADRVLTGEIVLPKYQRAFVWGPQQVLELLDSVLRDYPIGSLLLWETTEQLASEQTV